MRTFSIRCLFGITALMLSFDWASLADTPALAARLLSESSTPRC